MKKAKKKSLRAQLVIIIGIFVFVLLAFEGIISLTITQKAYKAKMAEEYAAETEYFGSVVDGLLLEDAGLLTAEVSVLSASESAADVLKLISVLEDITESNAAVTMAYIGFEDGNLVNGSKWVPDAGWDCRTRGWYVDAKANPGTIIYSDPYVDDNTGNVVVTISKYFDLGTWVGVAAVDLNMDEVLTMLDTLASVRLNEGDYVFVMGASNTMVHHPNAEFLPTSAAQLTVNEILGGAYATAIAEGTSFVDYTGTTCNLTAVTSVMTGWTTVYVSPSAYYEKQVNQNKNQVFVVFVVCMLIACAATFVVATLISNSLNKAAKDVNTIVSGIREGHGDLSHPIETKSKDEIGVLVGGINEMMSALGGVIKEIDGATESLIDDVKTLKSAASTTTDNVNNISATMEEMSASSQETSASTSQVSQQISDIAGLAAEVQSNTSEKTREISKSLEESAVQKQKMEEQDAKMAERLSKAIASLQEKIEATGKVEEIRQMTQGISDVASQTNLLSLNASIEAARAGEMGKGFAVVAGEIGSLANNSAEMASNIQRVSDEVLDIVDQLVKAAKEVSDVMMKISEENVETKNALMSDYTKALQECYDAMSVIAGNSDEIASAVENIRDSMDAIDIAVEENSQGITTVANGATDLVEASNDVLERALSVGEISERLQNEVKKFIV